MLFDLHIHQSEHSADSVLNIEQAIREAKMMGLSGICITDHDNIGLRPKAEILSEKYDIVVIVGVEIYSLDGDILCYGLDELPSSRLSAAETIDFVHKRGGVCIAAHPYRHNNRGLKDMIYSLDLDAIETYNGRTSLESNLKAEEAARTIGIASTGSSDAHSKGEIGNYATAFATKISNESDFIEAVKLGDYKPVSLTGLALNEKKLA